jgi:hypothetical protein
MLHPLLQKNKIKLHTMTKKRINVESSVFFIISKITIISIYYWSGSRFFSNSSKLTLSLFLNTPILFLEEKSI